MLFEVMDVGIPSFIIGALDNSWGLHATEKGG